VSVYNGQLDLICSTLGLDAWLPKLAWDNLAAFQVHYCSKLRPLLCAVLS